MLKYLNKLSKRGSNYQTILTDKVSQYINNTNVEVIYKLMQTRNATYELVSTSRNHTSILFASKTGSIKNMTTHPTNPLMINTKMNLRMNKMQIQGII